MDGGGVVIDVALLRDCRRRECADWIEERLMLLGDESATEDAHEHARAELHGIVSH
jgi:hypothetical protein